MAKIELRSDMGVSLIQHMGSDAAVVAAARVSTKGVDSQEFMATDPKESAGLINFLMKNRHGTPFEHNAMTFLIEAPIFVFREFHRHRVGWSYNEESGRYKQLAPMFYIPDDTRPIKQVGKPGRYEFVMGNGEDLAVMETALTRSYKKAYEMYEMQLTYGIAREVARMVLPVAVYSSMYATCNARSLMHFLSLRTSSSMATFPSYPMREIEMVANGMEEQFGFLFPITYECWYNNGRVCP